MCGATRYLIHPHLLTRAPLWGYLSFLQVQQQRGIEPDCSVTGEQSCYTSMSPSHSFTLSLSVYVFTLGTNFEN